MRLTVTFNESGKQKKINFLMPDEFDEKKIQRGGKKEIKKRWPHVLRVEHEITWKF